MRIMDERQSTSLVFIFDGLFIMMYHLCHHLPSVLPSLLMIAMHNSLGFPFHRAAGSRSSTTSTASVRTSSMQSPG